MGQQLIQAQDIPLASLLTQGCFCVPWHQRTYDWEKSHVESLLDDLSHASQDDVGNYFLGSVMLVPMKESKSTWEINDGQQRTITFSMICAGLYKHISAKQGGGGEI